MSAFENDPRRALDHLDQGQSATRFLAGLLSLGPLHGDMLQKYLVGSFCGDAAEQAGQILVAAERLGWIRRAPSATPTHSQRAFNVFERRSPKNDAAHPEWFVWSIIPDKRAEVKAFAVRLGEKPPERIQWRRGNEPPEMDGRSAYRRLDDGRGNGFGRRRS